MSNAKLFDKLRTLIEDARDADKKHIKKLRKVLRKLKERQNELRDKQEDVHSESERRKIEQEIAVISLQRGKGVEVYRQLKAARKQRKEGKTSDSAGLAPNPDEPGKTS
jgi:rubrerythrin